MAIYQVLKKESPSIIQKQAQQLNNRSEKWKEIKWNNNNNNNNNFKNKIIYIYIYIYIYKVWFRVYFDSAEPKIAI